MNARNNCVKVLAFIVLIVFPIFAYGQTIKLKKSHRIYADTINHIISCCNSKSSLANSEHEKIRMTGELASRKAEFCSTHKQQLIEEMTNMNLPPKKYKIEYMVSTKFLEFERNSVLSGR